MRLWDVVLQNAAGRQTTWTGHAATGTVASTKALKHEIEQTGDDTWMVLHCIQRG